MISANGNAGIWITGAGTTGVVVQHNFIGTDVTSTKALGNAYSGVEIDGARRTLPSAGPQPTLADGSRPTGRTASGSVMLGPPGSSSSTISSAPTSPVRRPWETPTTATHHTGAANNTIGGTTAGAGNVISANQNCGILIAGDGASGNLIQGNKIGTDVTGTVALGNAFWGVGILESGREHGGWPDRRTGNIVSGNEQGGVAIQGIDAVGDLVQGNLIGTDATGTRALGNGYSGVYVGDWGDAGNAASNATIDGTTAGIGNVISANGNEASGSPATGRRETVDPRHKLIGTDLTGTKALENATAPSRSTKARRTIRSAGPQPTLAT